MDSTMIVTVGVLLLVAVAYFLLELAKRDEAGKRTLLADLVKYAQMRLSDQAGRDRFKYVMEEFKAHYPRVPVEWIETAIESALFDAKAQAGLITAPKTQPLTVEKPNDAPRWRN